MEKAAFTERSREEEQWVECNFNKKRECLKVESVYRTRRIKYCRKHNITWWFVFNCYDCPDCLRIWSRYHNKSSKKTANDTLILQSRFEAGEKIK
jgi:hypothetical protein